MSSPSDAGPLDDLLDDDHESSAPPQVESADEEWLLAPQRQRRLPRLPAALVTCILLALAFTGGVLVQKHHDKGATSSSLPAAFSGGFPSGLAGGSLPGTAGSTGNTSGGNTGSNASTPAVIGTVVSVHGRVLTVRNLAGKTVNVTVPASVKVTQQSSSPLTSLARGRSVTVDGTTSANGSVTASSITSR